MGEERHAALSAAMDAAEEGLDHNAAVEKVTAVISEPKSLESPAAPASSVSTPAAPAVTSTPATPPKEPPAAPVAQGVPATPAIPAAPKPEDRAPVSWKAGLREKWSGLDPEVKSEVLRRDVEVTRALNDSAQARQFVGHFQQVLAPYEARIQALGGNPVQVVQALMRADHILSTAPTQQRATYLAQIIKDYDINIEALDAALSGTMKKDPNEEVQRLVQQQLQPFYQYMQQQQQTRQQQEQMAAQHATSEIDQMAANTVQYPYFEQVRETIADVIELMAKKGVPISLPEAYNKAVLMDPTISQELASQTQAQQRATQAAQVNARATRALQASQSVKGAPGGPTGGSSSATDRRAHIEAAMDALGT